MSRQRYSVYRAHFSAPDGSPLTRAGILEELRDPIRKRRTDAARRYAAQCEHGLTCGERAADDDGARTPKCWARLAYDAVKTGGEFKGEDGKPVLDANGKPQDWGAPDGWSATGVWRYRAWDLPNPADKRKPIRIERGVQSPNWLAPSGDVMLDIDHIPPSKMIQALPLLREIPGCWLTHITYSEIGYRAVVSVSPKPLTEDQHKAAELKVRAYADALLKPLGLVCDSATPDSTRYSFLNYAPDAELHEGNGEFALADYPDPSSDIGGEPASDPKSGASAGGARRDYGSGSGDFQDSYADLAEAYAFYNPLERSRQPYQGGSDAYIEFISLGIGAGLHRSDIEAACARGLGYEADHPDEIHNWSESRYAGLAGGRDADACKRTIFDRALKAGWRGGRRGRGRPRTDNPSEKTEANRQSEVRKRGADLPEYYRISGNYLEGSEIARIIQFLGYAAQSDRENVYIANLLLGSWRKIPATGKWDMGLETSMRLLIVKARERAREEFLKEYGDKPEWEDYAAQMERDFAQRCSARHVRECISHLGTSPGELPYFGKPHSHMREPLIPLAEGGAWDVRNNRSIDAKKFLSYKFLDLRWGMPKPTREDGDDEIVAAFLAHYRQEVADRLAYQFLYAAKRTDSVKAPTGNFGKSQLTTLLQEGIHMDAVKRLDAKDLSYAGGQFDELKNALGTSLFVHIQEGNNAEPAAGAVNILVEDTIQVHRKYEAQEEYPRYGRVTIFGRDWAQIPMDDPTTRLRFSWAWDYEDAPEMSVDTERLLRHNRRAGGAVVAYLLERAAVLWREGVAAANESRGRIMPKQAIERRLESGDAKKFALAQQNYNLNNVAVEIKNLLAAGWPNNAVSIRELKARLKEALGDDERMPSDTKLRDYVRDIHTKAARERRRNPNNGGKREYFYTYVRFKDDDVHSDGESDDPPPAAGGGNGGSRGGGSISADAAAKVIERARESGLLHDPQGVTGDPVAAAAPECVVMGCGETPTDDEGLCAAHKENDHWEDMKRAMDEGEEG